MLSRLSARETVKKFMRITSIKRNFYLYSPEPFHPISGREPVWMSPEDAVGVIKSDSNVFIHGGVCTPTVLVDAMMKHGKDARLENVKVWHILTDSPFMDEEYKDIFRSQNLFLGGNKGRAGVNEGRGDYIPIFLSEIPHLFRRNLVRLDVALIHITPPDKHGYCSLGASVDCTRSAVQNAKYIIGQVNSNMPRTFGDGNLHISHIDVLTEGNLPLPAIEVNQAKELAEAEKKIGKLIATCLVQDGCTLQLGIGSVPITVLEALGRHRDIGIHSEVISDGIIDLVEKGVITNAKKSIHTGKILSSIASGSDRLYNFLDNNPFVVMNDVAFVNNISVIMQNPKVTAINACIEIDLTGQIVSDSIGNRIYSGFGGQIDFLRGAAQSTDHLGKPIIALPSTTKTGDSRIVPFIKQGAGVVTTRAHVHYVVTEYGIGYLFGKNLRQRAYELVRIAHPDHREVLEKAAFERLKCMPSAD